MKERKWLEGKGEQDINTEELDDGLQPTHLTENKTQEEWNKNYYKRNSDERKKKYQEKLRADGKISEKEKLSQRREKIKALLEQGFKQKDICLSLNISKRTCINDIKYLKEQGLI